MGRILYFMIFNMMAFRILASDLVLIPTKNYFETKAIFSNPVVTVNFYSNEFVIATLNGSLERPFIKLDGSAWETNFSYYLVYLDIINRAEYLSEVGSQVKVLYDSGQYLILKTDETAFGPLKPAKNDGMVRFFNIGAKLPEPNNLLKSASLIPDPYIAAMINRVESSNITSTVQQLQDYGHRGWLNPSGFKAQNWIKDVFTGFNYKVEVMDFFEMYPNGSDNVIATKIGKKYPDEYVILGGHYDSYSYYETAPGADDNASGVAGLLEAARILSQYDFDRTIIFCAFSGEEYGLYGSHFYANRCSEQGMRILGYFNLDMIGYLKPGNPISTDVYYTTTALPLFEFYQKVCSIYLPEFNVRSAAASWGMSDYYSFNSAGYMGIFPFEDKQNYSPYIHTFNDVVGISYNNSEQAGIFTKATIASVVTLANISSGSIPVKWFGSISSDWNTPGNWQPNIVPKATDNVTILSNYDDPVVNEDAAKPAVCNNLTIIPSGLLTINPGKALTVNGNIIGSDSIKGLIIKSDVNGTGSLKVLGSITASATVQRFLNNGKGYLISSPIGKQTLKDFIAKNVNIPVIGSTTAYEFSEFSNSGIFGWNPNFTVDYLNKNPTKALEFGKGYWVRTASGANPERLDFEGVLNSPSTTSINLSSTAADGWNLIGNPLAAAIKLSDNTPETSETDNFLEVNQANFDPNSYGVYKLNGASGDNDEYEVINKTSGNTFAKVGQGFFVKKKDNAIVTSMSVTPAMQFHITSDQLKTGELTYPEIKLTVSGSGKSASTKIKFIETTHEGLDVGYDAGIFKANPEFSLYTKLVEDNGSDFQLQCLPTNQYDKLVIPIGLDYKNGGEVVFSALASNLDAGCTMILEDVITNSFTDLSKNNYKTEVTANTAGSNRFFLYTAKIKGFENQITDGKRIAYSISNIEIRLIGKVSDGAEATLYDASGRIILFKILGAGILNIIDLPNIKSGLYLLNINDKGATQTIKVLIRK